MVAGRAPPKGRSQRRLGAWRSGGDERLARGAMAMGGSPPDQSRPPCGADSIGPCGEVAIDLREWRTRGSISPHELDAWKQRRHEQRRKGYSEAFCDVCHDPGPPQPHTSASAVSLSDAVGWHQSLIAVHTRWADARGPWRDPPFCTMCDLLPRRFFARRRARDCVLRQPDADRR